ncbi:MAG: GGDEF domain-containing protein [bacterium]
MKIENTFQFILDNLDTPIIIINEKTKEYEWLNKKAQEIIEKFQIHPEENISSKLIADNKLYRIKNLKLQNENKVIILEIDAQNFIDNETELLNFQGFFIKYETLYFLLSRKKKNFYISLINIDQFENLIKNFSYYETLNLSKKIASIIKSKIRNNIDILSKYDINCFLLLLTEVDEQKNIKILERLQKAVIDYFKKEYSYILTVSIVSLEINPSLKENTAIFEDLQNKIQKLLKTLEYQRKIKVNFIHIQK